MANNLILVLNCGSSSVKFSVIKISEEKKLISGVVEFVDTRSVKINRWCEGTTTRRSLPKGMTSSSVFDLVVDEISSSEFKLCDEITSIGHRVVHGGRNLTKSVTIDASVIGEIKDAIQFAPLHNPAHVLGIEEMLRRFPHLADRNVAVFDTAFHRTIPEEAYLYAIPYFLNRRYSLRRYGAHGISHSYVTVKAADVLNKSPEEVNLITCHLGNGSSVSAIRLGKCVDTSMGLTPLEGLVMGTRSGDVDPSVVFYLHNSLGMSVRDIELMLTRESGLLGLSEMTSDCRRIEEEYHSDARARRAMDVYCYRLAKYIGSYSILMDDDLDALIFTGGIGENSSMVRELSLNRLSRLGFKVDGGRNADVRFGKTGVITTDDSTPAVVIPTDEELMIARDVDSLTAGMSMSDLRV